MDSSLIIGVATSTAERVQLVRLLGGADALLLVSSADQARAFLDPDHGDVALASRRTDSCCASRA
jgi:hypothetical protein